MLNLSDEELILELQNRFQNNKKNLEELKKLNKILTKVNNKLSEAEAMKSHFISNISNEMINPFTSILALSRTILEVDKENWKKVVSLIALIHSEAFNLDFQFKNIFCAAKIEAGEISQEISKVDIEGLVDDVIDTFKYIGRKKKLKIKKQIDIKSKKNRQHYFKTDCEKLKIILSNLISNAIKFSFDEGIVELKCTLTNKRVLEIKIADFGEGISSKNLEIIFDRFKQLDSGISSVNRGHGLGLSVIKDLIDLFNGTIKVESDLNKGTKFYIQIPESTSESEGYTIDGNELIFEEEVF